MSEIIMRSSRQGVKIDFALDSSGSLEGMLPEHIDMSAKAYEVYLSGATTLNAYLYFCGNEGHDVFQGRLALISAGSVQQGHMTAGIDSGTRGHVPMIIIAPKGSWLSLTGAADAEGYIELFAQG